MNLETKITIYKFTPQVFTLTRYVSVKTENSQSFSFIVSFPELNMKH